MLRSAKNLRGFAIGAKDGDIGEADDFIFDDKNWTVRYVVADTERWLPGRKVLISPLIVDQADWEGKRLPVLISGAGEEQSGHQHGRTIIGSR